MRLWHVLVGLVVTVVLVLLVVFVGVPAVRRGVTAQAALNQAAAIAAAKQTLTVQVVAQQAASNPTAMPTSAPISVPTTVPSPTVVQSPTGAPTSAPTVAPSATAQQVSNPTTSAQGASSQASTVSLTSTNGSSKYGIEAWHAENQLDGSLYGGAPIGGLSEETGIVAQVWTDKPVVERWLFYVPPHTVIWLSGHRGGTGWWFNPNGDVSANLQKQWDELRTRDGEVTTTVIVLPGDASKFRLLARMQVALSFVITPTMAVTSITPTPTSVAPKPSATVQTTATVTTSVVASGKCNIGAESVGPCILEGSVNGKATVVKLNAGAKYSLAVGNCWPLASQADLDARWSNHKAGFLAKYPDGVALEIK